MPAKNSLRHSFRHMCTYIMEPLAPITSVRSSLWPFRRDRQHKSHVKFPIREKIGPEKPIDWEGSRIGYDKIWSLETWRTTKKKIKIYRQFCSIYEDVDSDKSLTNLQKKPYLIICSRVQFCIFLTHLFAPLYDTNKT